MKSVRGLLDNIPKSFADNPQANLLSLCTQFIKEVDDYTNGKPNDDSKHSTFLRDALPFYRAFKSAINETRPLFKITPVIPEIGPPSLSEAEDLPQVKKDCQGISPFYSLSLTSQRYLSRL